MTSVSSPSSKQSSKPSLATTHPFTCNTCQVAFRSNDAQRTHYHTDWHQYNLKRKVATLPPLSSETFAEKILHAQANTRLEHERAVFEKLCKACNKTYFSENAYANHVGSQKHRQNVATMQMNAIRAGGSGVGGVALDGRNNIGAAAVAQDRDETGSVSSSTFSLGEPVEDGEKSLTEKVENLQILDGKKESTPSSSETPVPSADTDPKSLALEACLFCNYLSPTLPLNVSHMTKAHGLFIPEANYLVDLPGLITYLGQKLLLGNQCLYCNKTKGGLEGIRTHMQDKGHTMLGFETEEQQLELGQFYDFRSTYSDAGEESSSSDETGPSKKRENDGEDRVPADGEDLDGDGWETDSSDDSIDSTELGSVPIDRQNRRPKGEKPRHHLEDGWHSHAHAHHIYHDEYELHLPSGRSVGHRSLARYYRQNLRDRPLQDASVLRIANTDSEGNQETEEDGVATEEQALNRRERREEARFMARRNEQGLVGVSAAQRRELVNLQKRSQAEEQRGRRKFERSVNLIGNDQKHFRQPFLQ